MIRNIIFLFITVIFVLFFSTTCLCQEDTAVPADTGSSTTDEGVKKDEGAASPDEKKEKAAEEKKKAEEKAKEEEKKAEEETLQIQEENLETWGEYAPEQIDSSEKESNNIWNDDQGFIDR